MKPTRFRALLLAAVAILPSPGRAAPGDLDLGFEPIADEQSLSGSIRVNGREIYIWTSSAQRRFTDNGSLDSQWQLTATAQTPFRGFGTLPAGGWFLSGSDALYLEAADHSIVRITGASNARQIYPADNGSVLVVAGVVVPGRFLSDGISDRMFDPSVIQSLVPTGYPGGFGGPTLTSVQDSTGRIIIGGNFREAAGVERLGMTRLLPDGALDPTWNPASNMGLGLLQSGSLNGRPDLMTTGPDDSVVVQYRFQPTDSPRIDKLATITAAGAVVTAGLTHQIFGEVVRSLRR